MGETVRKVAIFKFSKLPVTESLCWVLLTSKLVDNEEVGRDAHLSAAPGQKAPDIA